MAHLVVAHPNMKIDQFPGDVLGPSYYVERVVSNRVEIVEPFTTAPSGPGLGVGELLL